MTSDTSPVIAIFMLLLIAFPVLLETSACFFTCYREIGSDIIRWQLLGAGAPGSGLPRALWRGVFGTWAFGFLLFGFVVLRCHVERGRSQYKSRQKCEDPVAPEVLSAEETVRTRIGN